MSYKTDEDAEELLARRIKAMHIAAAAANGTPRDAADFNYDQTMALREHYSGDPGVNPAEGVFINPEGESLDHPEPGSAAAAIKANGILKDLLGDEFSPQHQWNVAHFVRLDADKK
ncbi:hypothetical protein HX836_04100 [Pseudomonas yamanorum]|uniref:hypothetical protein n=1 Tax=Pseudomonas yamanorum TaxID=515393 RepID=UPI0015A4A6A1|nr:hypothetical protein [Pseudomonas yamanorum]NVZ80974.1 hypothetical protein [Pseudomonas yamanorum]